MSRTKVNEKSLFAGHFGQVSLCLVLAVQLSKRRDQDRVTGPLEIRLTEGPERELGRPFIVGREYLASAMRTRNEPMAGSCGLSRIADSRCGSRFRGPAGEDQRRAEAVMGEREARVEFECGLRSAMADGYSRRR